MTITIDMQTVILEADANGAPYRLEYVRGRLKIEASPAARHQKTAKRIERSIAPATANADCGCFSLQDVLIRFPDPDISLKRPDIAIFCAEPPDSDEALEIVPDAIIEIISLGYEEKDLGPDGAPFYLACGVQDVLIVDPREGSVRHFRINAAPTTHAIPYSTTLQCGCTCTI